MTLIDNNKKEYSGIITLLIKIGNEGYINNGPSPLNNNLIFLDLFYFDLDYWNLEVEKNGITLPFQKLEFS